jgi:alkanesulfonate monooxygenase SsuD/methylene tetrahydromethanopterin reductase-like flavin-dependent oxidoreductase (luciferase family)
MEQDSAKNKKMSVGTRTRHWGWVARIAILTLLLSPLTLMTVQAASTESEADRLAIIELIEDRLAGAYRILEPEDTPCFGTLDEIYPQWHKGEPAEARRRWTLHNYQFYEVSYLVESITVKNPDQVVAKAVKIIDQARWRTFFIFPPELKRENFKKNVTIVCNRNPSNAWQVLREVIN